MSFADDYPEEMDDKEPRMIDYDKIHHCLQHIITDCENAEDYKDAIESVLHTAKHALNLMELPHD